MKKLFSKIKNIKNVSSKTIKTFCKNLDINHTKSNSRNNKWLEITNSSKHIWKFLSGKCGNFSERQNNIRVTEVITEQTVFRSQERWGWKTCNQSEAIKPVHALSTFQYGGSTLPQRTYDTRRLNVKTRSERLMLLYFSRQKFKKICSISVGW